MTPYYDDGTVTIYHGDCFDLLPGLEPETAHVTITDPPYFRTVDDDWDDQWGADVSVFIDWIGKVLDEAKRVTAQRGTIAVFCSHDMACAVELEVRRRFQFLNHIVWRKPNPGRLGRMDKESMRRFFPASERIILAEQARNPDGDLFRFVDHVNHQVARDVYADIRLRLVELRDRAGLTHQEVDAALGCNSMAAHYFGGSQWYLPTEANWEVIAGLLTDRGVVAPLWQDLRQEFDSRRQEFDSRRREFDSRRREFDSRRREFDSRYTITALELLSDVWTFDPPPPSQRWHPTQKPNALMRHLVSMLSRQDDLILDPFAGSGSTLRAAKDLGRRAIGIEVEERYCEIAARRMGQEVLDFGTAP